MRSDISKPGALDKQGTESDAARRPDRPVIVIGGPTASGKSALALAIALEFNGRVINADSMQVYLDLPILTAQPSPGDMAKAPHALYGMLALDELCSASRWASWALAEIAAAHDAGQLPILIGGTGLYLRSLMQGLSPVPDVTAAQRAAVRALMAEIGVAAMHERLLAADPVMGRRLHPNDSQRIMRAWEVLQATGRSLAEWQLLPSLPPDGLCFQSWVVLPPRDRLYAACDRRFLAMLAHGAMAEVAAAIDRYGTAILEAPGGKALGFAELVAVRAGRMSSDEAIAAAQQLTRNYAKRQTTWFRHQASKANFISPDDSDMKFSESSLEGIFQNIRDFGLTTT
jgi:tRNA dimethylallyltransferase